MAATIVGLSVLPFALDRSFFPFLNPVMFKGVYRTPEHQSYTFRARFLGESGDQAIPVRHPFFGPKSPFTFATMLQYALGGLGHIEARRKLFRVVAALLESGNRQIQFVESSTGQPSKFKVIRSLDVYRSTVWIDGNGRRDQARSSDELLFSVEANLRPNE